MLGIKGRIKRFLSLSTILAMLLMSVPSMAATVYDFEGTFDITAGQNTIIGEATVIIDGGQLTIDVNLDEGQEAKEYQLFILDAIPTERLSPGQAEIKDDLDPEQEDFQIGPIQIDLDELDPGQCQDLYLMLHLAVGTETAYAGDIVNPEGGAWFGFIHIELCEPDDPDPEFGSLTLFKFHDMNENGEFDEGEDMEDSEHALSGIEFEIYNEDDEELEGSPFTTDDDGLIELTNLPVGEYTIKELSGYAITGQVFADGLLSITIEKDQTTRVEIGNIIPDDTFDVRIVKFEDLNQDGEMNGNDDFLEDIHFKLFEDPEDDTPLQHGYTDEDGELLFSGLVAGTYYLQEHSSAIITTPVFDDDGFFEIEVGGEDSDDPLEIKIGNYFSEEEEDPEPGTIIVHKFNDTDRDGVKDENESWLPGISFELFESMSDDDPIATGTTNSSGMITFSGLEPGDYFLDELGNRIITTSVNSQGFIEVMDLDEEETIHVYVGNYRQSPPPPRDDDDDEDPVEFGMLRIQKFLDSDEDGIFDADEFEMVGITFELYDAEKDDLISTKVTDSEGVITFPNLEFGEYYLREVSDFRITTEGFDADGFTSEPIEIDSEDVLIITVGNFRDEVPAVVVVELPAEIEIVEEPIPLALPDTGEAGAQSYYILGSLIMLAGMFLKRLR
jgi:LPXTG-motif cell wall-anchored protein